MNEAGLEVTEQQVLEITTTIRVRKFIVDIGKKKQVDDMVDAVVDGFGRLDYGMGDDALAPCPCVFCTLTIDLTAINVASVCLSTQAPSFFPRVSL